MKITVAVCTHERPELLERCLQTLLPQLTNQDELLVVDSAPLTGQTSLILNETPAHYIYVARPGLDVARNAAVEAAQGDIVAFVDDDVVVSNDWMAALRRAFSDVTAACVTGRTRP
ncbi:MAG: glycosyltransferase [Anaerolineae bacterium]